MNRQPIVIRVSKTYAGIVFTVMFILSIYGFVCLFGENRFTAVEKIVLALFSLFGFFVAPFGIFSLFSRRFEYNPRKPVYSDKEPFITITDQEIKCNYPSKHKEEKIRWEDISLIQVLTTDEGPAVCDVFIVLTGHGNQGVALPSDKEETRTALNRITKFNGFDHQLFIQAMGSAENKWFTVWKKPGLNG